MSVVLRMGEYTPVECFHAGRDSVKRGMPKLTCQIVVGTPGTIIDVSRRAGAEETERELTTCCRWWSSRGYWSLRTSRCSFLTRRTTCSSQERWASRVSRLRSASVPSFLSLFITLTTSPSQPYHQVCTKSSDRPLLGHFCRLGPQLCRSLRTKRQRDSPKARGAESGRDQTVLHGCVRIWPFPSDLAEVGDATEIGRAHV